MKEKIRKERRMGKPILGKAGNGEPMHFSVGAVIQNDEDKYLLIERRNPPFGFAGIAGHIDEGESRIDALLREIFEESGLRVSIYELIFEEEIRNNTCKRGVNIHIWHLYECCCSGRLRIEKVGAKSIDWYSKEEIQQMANNGKLEPVWKYWFKKLGVIL